MCFVGWGGGQLHLQSNNTPMNFSFGSIISFNIVYAEFTIMIYWLISKWIVDVLKFYNNPFIRNSFYTFTVPRS